MERKPNYCCTLASLAALFFFLSFPARSWSKLDDYKPLKEDKQECCLGDVLALKRFDDLDDQSFVSLMGRRSAAQANGNVDHIFADLMRRETRKARVCAQNHLHPRSGRLINHRRPRSGTLCHRTV
ncbi:uncharacterized protein ACBR49_013765 [Aulostomus maculatus]